MAEEKAKSPFTIYGTFHAVAGIAVGLAFWGLGMGSAKAAVAVGALATISLYTCTVVAVLLIVLVSALLGRK